MIVTIDGPTASGKSVVARALAQELGFYYLPTGWFYRAVAYLLVYKCNYTEDMLPHVTEEDVRICVDISRLMYVYDKAHGGALFYDGRDITSYLKDHLIDRYVSIISPLATVRTLVTQAQRAFAHIHDSIIEGRDTGSVVFPYADFKFFLTADLSVRASRWKKDQEKRGNNFSIKEAEERVESRDRQDKGRSISPLIVPEGAIIIDNSDLTQEETVKKFLEYIKQ